MQEHDWKASLVRFRAARGILFSVSAIGSLRRDRPRSNHLIWEHFVIGDDARPLRKALHTGEIIFSWLTIMIHHNRHRFFLIELGLMLRYSNRLPFDLLIRSRGAVSTRGSPLRLPCICLGLLFSFLFRIIKIRCISHFDILTSSLI